MADEFEYFSEFLENPSAPGINEFFRMLRRWGQYLEAHQDEFDYLEDDAWKEIRERLIDDLELRVDAKDELGLEWEKLDAEIEATTGAKDSRAVELLTRKLDFMKNYRYVFDIPEEDIAGFEKLLGEFRESLEDVQKIEQSLMVKKMVLKHSIAELEEEMFRYYEQTGKIPTLPTFGGAKVHKGN